MTRRRKCFEEADQVFVVLRPEGYPDIFGVARQKDIAAIIEKVTKLDGVETGWKVVREPISLVPVLTADDITVSTTRLLPVPVKAEFIFDYNFNTNDDTYASDGL